MKNILRKIGVIGIIIAMLAPFIELPVVKAANEECTDHTVLQYYFLDVASGGSYNDWMAYTKTYSTYTQFYFTFPNDVTSSSNKEIKILKVSTDYINDGNELADYAQGLMSIIKSNTGGDYTIENNGVIKEKGVIANSEKSQNTTYTGILHGKWETKGTSSKEQVQLSKLAGWIGTETEGSSDLFKNNTIQTKIGNVSSDGDVKVTIKGVGYDGENVKPINGYNSGSNLVEFFQELANKKNESLYYTDSDGATWLALNINRTISDTKLKQVKFGYKSSGDGKYYKYNDYTEMSKTQNQSTSEVNNETDLDILATNQIYWPVILNVEYEVCPTTSEQWTLKYDGNTDDNSVTNIPSSQTETIGTDIQIDAKKPSRDGYTFQGWNTQRDGKGTSYNAEDTYKSPSEKTTVTLYAQWGKGGTEDNKKTGVMSYVVGFITTGLVASGIYLVAKKKNLFKQI